MYLAEFSKRGVKIDRDVIYLSVCTETEKIEVEGILKLLLPLVLPLVTSNKSYS